MDKKYQVEPIDALRIWKWLQEQGGIQIWGSADFGDLNSFVTCPVLDTDGNVNKPPDWKHIVKDRTITSPDDVEVIEYQEVKRFKIGTKRGSGLTIVLTNASDRKLKEELAKTGEDALYVFEGSVAIISVPKILMTLREYISKSESQRQRLMTLHTYSRGQQERQVLKEED